MKSIYILSISMLAAASVAAESGSVRVPQGTPVPLRLEKTVSSATTHATDRVEFTVLRDVGVDAATVIPKGSAAWGTITAAAPRGRMGRSGKLAINVDAVCLANGERAALRAIPDLDPPAVRKASADGRLTDSLLAFPAWPVMLFLYGKDVTAPKGSEFTAYLNDDLNLSAESLRGSHKACTAAVAEPRPEPPVEIATVTVKSTPAGADIRVDGKYVGNTPSILRLEPGDHSIAIAAPGRGIWSRTITVGRGGDVTVSAVLETDRDPVAAAGAQ
jgi:hypothetical protein